MKKTKEQIKIINELVVVMERIEEKNDNNNYWSKKRIEEEKEKGFESYSYGRGLDDGIRLGYMFIMESIVEQIRKI